MSLILFALMGFAAFAQESTHQLVVRVSGATPGRGQALLSLFSSPENYLNTPLREKAEPIDENGEVIFVLEQLKPGTYAVSIVYDEDGNGRLNTGFLRIPTELVGFSNNVKGAFGPPSFENASFVISGPHEIEIMLGKAKD